MFFYAAEDLGPMALSTYITSSQLGHTTLNLERVSKGVWRKGVIKGRGYGMCQCFRVGSAGVRG